MAVDKLVDSTQLDGYFSDIADAIRGKNGSSDTYTPSQMPQAITDIPSGGGGEAPENDVEFIDYDGTRVYSYTKAEFLALTELPANPTHEGLTSQGWNWTLSEAKAYVQNYGMLVIGQYYITDDGKTRLYVDLDDNHLNPKLRICPVGTIEINWGDGSTDTLSGTSATSMKSISHVYTAAGKYIIQITIEGSNYASIYGGYSRSQLLGSNLYSDNATDMAYLNCIYKIELGDKMHIGLRAFYYLYNLETITIPKDIICENNSYVFYNCYRLKSIVIPTKNGTYEFSLYNTFSECNNLKNISFSPNSVTSISSSCFINCKCLKKITPNEEVININSSGLAQTGIYYIIIPNRFTTFYNYALSNSYLLRKISLPSTLATINSNAFADCYSLSEIHFKSTTPPTVSSSNAFSNIPLNCKIYVPTGYLSAYTSATNYPSSSTYTYIEE